MFLGSQLSYGARLIAVVVSLLPLYLTLTSIREAPFLSQKGRDLVSHPVSIALIAYGTGYAALGDAGATASSMIAILIMIYYIFILRPDIGREYFNTTYVKENLTDRKK